MEDFAGLQEAIVVSQSSGVGRGKLETGIHAHRVILVVVFQYGVTSSHIDGLTDSVDELESDTRYHAGCAGGSFNPSNHRSSELRGSPDLGQPRVYGLSGMMGTAIRWKVL